MHAKVKPDYSKEYANKTKEVDFVEHFKKAYPELSEAEISESWKDLQDKKEAPKKAEVKAESK